MKTYTMQEQPEHSIFTGTLPFAGEDIRMQPEEKKDSMPQEIRAKKKYHSSATYAAGLWHKSVGHVKAHSHKALDIYNP